MNRKPPISVCVGASPIMRNQWRSRRPPGLPRWWQTLGSRLATHNGLHHRHKVGGIGRGVAAGVFAVMVLVAVGYALSLGEQLRFPDELDYTTIASNLSAGRGFSLDGEQPTAYRPPGYALVVLAAQGLPRPVTAARLLNMLAYGAALWLVYRLAARERGSGAGIAAMLLVAVYPVLLYTAGTLYPQALAAALLLCLTAIFGSSTALSIRRAALCGGLCGLLILTVPSFFFLPVLLAAWTVYEGRFRGRAIRRAAVIGLAAACVLLPWQIRNARVFGQFVFVSTNGGINLLLGNSPGTTAGSGVNVNLDTWHAEARGLDEVARDRFYRHAAMDWIRANPRRAFALYVRKLAHHFHFRNRLHTAGEHSPARDVVMALGYGLLIGLVLVRLVASRRVPLTRTERFILALYLVNAAFAALFFTRIRFRLPLDWLLTIPAGQALALALVFTRHVCAARATAATGSAGSQSGSDATVVAAPGSVDTATPGPPASSSAGLERLPRRGS